MTEKEGEKLVSSKILAVGALYIFTFIGGHALYVGRYRWAMLYITLTLLFWGSAFTPALGKGGAYVDIGTYLRIGIMVLGIILVVVDFVRIVFFKFCVVDVKRASFSASSPPFTL
ncbi:hypothetical protein [Halomonas sp. A29]|uniref:hypothetical protein n=1 Tax=Halomonas sp. A29 TaxID=3102786 RepID=UPI00398B1F1D